MKNLSSCFEQIPFICNICINEVGIGLLGNDLCVMRAKVDTDTAREREFIIQLSLNSRCVPVPRQYGLLVFAPDHLVDDGDVGLDDLDDDRRDVLGGVDVDRGAVVAVMLQRQGGVHRLQEALLVDACQDESGAVQ